MLHADQSVVTDEIIADDSAVQDNEFAHDAVTVITDSRAVNKAFSLRDGKVEKGKTRTIFDATAETVGIPTLADLLVLMRHLGDDPHKVIIFGYIPGVTKFRLLSKKRLAELGIDEGGTDDQGKRCFSRTKLNFKNSTLVPFDYDPTPDMPADLLYADRTAWWDAMQEMFPEYKGAGVLLSHSNSNRVLHEGQPVGKGGFHAIVQVTDPNGVKDRYKQVHAMALDGPFGYTTKGGKRSTIFDVALAAPCERIQYEGKPTVSDGLTVAPVDIQLIKGPRGQPPREAVAVTPSVPPQAALGGLPECAEVNAALEHVPQTDYKTWVTVGMALHDHSGGSDEGKAVWDEWSKRDHGGYRGTAEIDAKWESFGRYTGKPVTIATLFHLAAESGWNQLPSAQHPNLIYLQNALALKPYLEKYASVTVGCDAMTVTFEEVKGKLKYNMLRPNAIQEILNSASTWKIGANDKVMPTDAYQLWRKHKQKRVYKQVEYKPYFVGADEIAANPLRDAVHSVNRNRAKNLNLFPGFKLMPEEGDCSALLHHIKYIICNGDDALVDYYHSWNAHVLFRPGVKVGVVVIYSGPGGAGKNIAANVLLYALPSIHIMSVEELRDKNSVALHEALYGLMDEAIFSHDRSILGILNSIVTAEEVWVQEKFIAKYPMQSCSSWAITTEKSFAWPDGSKRRTCFLPIQPTYAYNMCDQQTRKEYFEPLIRDYTPDGSGNMRGIRAYMHWLQVNYEHRLNDWNPEDVPEAGKVSESATVSDITAFHKEHPVLALFMQLCMEYPQGGIVRFNDIYSAYEHSCRTHPESKNIVGRALTNVGLKGDNTNRKDDTIIWWGHRKKQWHDVLPPDGSDDYPGKKVRGYRLEKPEALAARIDEATLTKGASAMLRLGQK